jgi:hypothetical protein
MVCHNQGRHADHSLPPGRTGRFCSRDKRLRAEIAFYCECRYFRANETDAVKFTKPRVGPYDLCAGCGHFKISHGTASKPGKVNRLKPGELAYRILQHDGMSYGCRHFDLENPNCQCTSTGCSATPDGQNLCACEKFQNPWLVRKMRGATRKSRARKPVGVVPAVGVTNGTSEASEPLEP